MTDPCGSPNGIWPSNQVVLASEAVGHLYEEAVWNRVESLRNVHRYVDSSARGFSMVEARDHPSWNFEQGRGFWVPQFEAVLGRASASTSSEDLGAIFPKLQLLEQSFNSWSGLAFEASLLSGSGLWQFSSKFPGCQFWQLRGWKAASGKSTSAPTDSIWPLDFGRSRLLNWRCATSLVVRSVWGVHRLVAVDFPHEPPESPILREWNGSEAWWTLWSENFPRIKAIELFSRALDLLPPSLCRSDRRSLHSCCAYWRWCRWFSRASNLT